MALFQKSPERDTADKIAKLIKARDDNVTRLTAAESGLIACRAAVDQATLDDDDEKLDAALAAKRVAEDKAGALRAASVKINKAIADLETHAAAIAEQKLRAATAAEIEKVTIDLERAGQAFEHAATGLAIAARRAHLAAPDALPLIGYADGAARELPPAVAMVAQVLRHRAVLTISGAAPATLPKPEAPQTLKLVGQPPATKEVVPLRSIKYVNASGVVVCIGKLQRHGVPEKLAELALSSGVAVTVSDPRVRNRIGVFGAGTPNPLQCEWLGPPAADKPNSTGPAIMSSHFEPHPDVPKPFTVRVPVSPVEPVAVGARALPKE